MPVKKQVRQKTKYPCVYYNKTTNKYDLKYNYKVYDPISKRNKYQSKWAYNFSTLAEAKAELARLQNGGIVQTSKDITLAGAFDLWQIKARGQNFSPVTMNNTEQHMGMIYQFLPAETKLKDITEEAYQKLCSDIREHGYADETIRSINATFRKLINLCYKKKLIKENILDYSDNIRTKQKEEYRVVTKEEFEQLDNYFHTSKFVRLGVNNYPLYRLLVNLLYYTGIRIGECLALQYSDFESFNYYKKGSEPYLRLVPSEEDTKGQHLRGMRVRVTKAYVSDIKLTKDPKNFKKRTIPCPPALERLAMIETQNHLQSGGSLEDKIFTWGHGAANTMIKNACKKIDIPVCSCHAFRHTYISNLISQGVPLPVIEKVSGDTQQTILSRYSHMFESDETMVLVAMSNL